MSDRTELNLDKIQNTEPWEPLTPGATGAWELNLIIKLCDCDGTSKLESRFIRSVAIVGSSERSRRENNHATSLPDSFRNAGARSFSQRFKGYDFKK